MYSCKIGDSGARFCYTGSMSSTHNNPEDLLSVCGVPCFACAAFLRAKDPCPGCRDRREEARRKSGRGCAKKRCAAERGVRACFACDRFPCARIRDLAKRYAKDYDYDLIGIGLRARTDPAGLAAALRQRTTCKECGGVLDLHHRRCFACGKPEIE